MSWTGFDWTGPDYPRFIATSLNSNGRAGIVGYGLDGVWATTGDGQGGFSPPTRVVQNLGFDQSWRAAKHVRVVGDVGGPTNRPPVVDQAHLAAASPATAAATKAVGVSAPVLSAAAGLHVISGVIIGGVLSGGPRPDLVAFGDAGVWLALNNGDGTFGEAKFVLAAFDDNSGWQVERHPRLLADLTGDGFADLIGFGDAGVWTSVNQGAGDFAAAKFVLEDLGYNQGWRTETHVRQLADLTGDKRADIVGFGNAGVYTSLNTGGGGFAATKFVIADLGANQGWDPVQHPRYALDLTGDGKADIIGFGNDGVWTALGDGGGGFAAPKFVLENYGTNQGWSGQKHLRLMADTTGDGKPDIVAFGNDGVWVSRNNGDGTFAAGQLVLANLGFNQGWTVDNHPRMLADLTGDGKADIVGFGDAGVWTARNNGDGTFGAAQFVLADFGFHSGSSGIQHVFVLMLENRGFDHMLGFSGITGTDAVTGRPTTINGLTGSEANVTGGQTFNVQRGADNIMPVDPSHEFENVIVQLCGADAKYTPGGPYPPTGRTINNSGFALSYAESGASANVGEVMKCFTPAELPVLTQLAKEFVVCDQWHSSMPGPTWPNRMFVHAASSGYLDCSPSDVQLAEWEFGPGGGIQFGRGSIYDALSRAHLDWRIYAGDDIPVVSSLKGVSIVHDIRDIGDFASDLRSADYQSVRYTHIEPSYDFLNSFKSGSSQHPLAQVNAGEAYIKLVYEAIRNSPLWPNSLFIITWDEHGGFYDHVAPPPAPRPNDPRPPDNYNANGFVFDHYGPRVPAIIISPRIQQNLIDHRLYDHASVPAAIEHLFGLPPLTDRDELANSPTWLLGLVVPRANALAATVAVPVQVVSAFNRTVAQAADPTASINEGQVASFLIAVMSQDLEIPPPADQPAILARVRAIKTHADAQAYIADVQTRVAAARKAAQAAAVTTKPILTGVLASHLTAAVEKASPGAAPP